MKQETNGGHWRGIAGPGGRLLQALEPAALGLLHTRSCHTHPTTQARQYHVWMSPTGQNALRWRGRHVVHPPGDVIWLFLIKPRVPLRDPIKPTPGDSPTQKVHSSFPSGSPTPDASQEVRGTQHHGGCADGETGARVAPQPVDTVLLTVRELAPKVPQNSSEHEPHGFCGSGIGRARLVGSGRVSFARLQGRADQSCGHSPRPDGAGGPATGRCTCRPRGFGSPLWGSHPPGAATPFPHWPPRCTLLPVGGSCRAQTAEAGTWDPRMLTAGACRAGPPAGVCQQAG